MSLAQPSQLIWVDVQLLCQCLPVGDRPGILTLETFIKKLTPLSLQKTLHSSSSALLLFSRKSSLLASYVHSNIPRLASRNSQEHLSPAFPTSDATRLWALEVKEWPQRDFPEHARYSECLPPYLPRSCATCSPQYTCLLRWQRGRDRYSHQTGP